MTDPNPISIAATTKRPRGRPKKDPPIDAASAPTAAPTRPDMRATPQDARAAADARAKEILGLFDGTEMQQDEFAAPKPPDGWTYEWKKKTVLNQEDPAYMLALKRTGWSEVPASRHPEMMGAGYKGGSIERKGQVLMERPEEITNRFKERDRVAARNQVRTKEEQLGAAPAGQFERQNKDASLARVSKAFEPMPIPGDKS